MHEANWRLFIPRHRTRYSFPYPGVSKDSSGQDWHPGNCPHLGASLSFWQQCCWGLSSDVPQWCSFWMFMYPSVVTTLCIKCVSVRMVSHCHWHFGYTAGSIFSSMYCASVIFLARHAHLAVCDELWHTLHSSQQGEVENFMQRMRNMCTSNWSVMSHSSWSSMLHIDDSVCYKG